MNNFEKMSNESNVKCLSVLRSKINIIKCVEESDKYSSNDYIIQLPNLNNILIEFKLRSKMYDTLLIEKKKILCLNKKKKYYQAKGWKVNDVWIVNVVDNNCYIFSLNHLKNEIRKANIYINEVVMSNDDVNNFFINNNSMLLLTNSSCNRYTANSNDKIVKSVLYIPLCFNLLNKK